MTTLARWTHRHMALAVLIGMAGFAAFGFFSIRRDVETLRVISQDNILWTASQMEIELLRFQLSVADVGIEQTEKSIAIMRERFDILWSRIFMMGSGRVGRQIARWDEGFESVPRFQQYLRELEPVIKRLRPQDTAQVRLILRELQTFQSDLRLYTLRVVRGDMAEAGEIRGRIQISSQTTAAISVAAVLLSALALVLIMRDNRRQREMAEIHRRLARAAEGSSRAKSRFLGMMSHELRNPLNGVLGPLALLAQSDLSRRHLRLVEQARHSGQAMLQMISGMLDYGEIRDGRLKLRAEPFLLRALVDGVRADLAEAGRAAARVALDGRAPERVQGDVERLRHVFVNLAEYAFESADPSAVEILFRHDGADLIGEIRFAARGPAIDWKLDVVTGLGDSGPDQVAGGALRPQIARGLIAAARGVMSLVDDPDGLRAIRVAIPAPPLEKGRIRVLIESRSAALAAIYRAALRSDRIAFVAADEGLVDVVLVDAAGGAGEGRLAELRGRFPAALFVSLGATALPGSFDEVLDDPSDMTRLRSRILGDPPR